MLHPSHMNDCTALLDSRLPDSEQLCATLVGRLLEGRKLEEGHHEEEGFASCDNPDDRFNLGITILCVCTAAMAAGLTMGTVSLDAVDLRVKLRAGTEAERGYATRLLPLIENVPHHQLLVTLLLLNALANEGCCTLLHPTPLHTRLAQGHSRHVGARRAKPQAPQAYCTYTRAYHYAAPFFSKPRFPHFHSQARKRAKTCVTAGTEPGAAATARLQLTTLPPFFFFSNRTIWQPA